MDVKARARSAQSKASARQTDAIRLAVYLELEDKLIELRDAIGNGPCFARVRSDGVAAAIQTIIDAREEMRKTYFKNVESRRLAREQGEEDV